MQSNSNYRGEKSFTPQFGDSFSDTVAKEIYNHVYGKRKFQVENFSN